MPYTLEECTRIARQYIERFDLGVPAQFGETTIANYYVDQQNATLRPSPRRSLGQLIRLWWTGVDDPDLFDEHASRHIGEYGVPVMLKNADGTALGFTLFVDAEAGTLRKEEKSTPTREQILAGLALAQQHYVLVTVENRDAATQLVRSLREHKEVAGTEIWDRTILNQVQKLPLELRVHPDTERLYGAIDSLHPYVFSYHGARDTPVLQKESTSL